MKWIDQPFQLWIVFYNLVYNIFIERNYTLALSKDLSCTFDIVNKNVLLRKLENIGVCCTTLCMNHINRTASKDLSWMALSYNYEFHREVCSAFNSWTYLLYYIIQMMSKNQYNSLVSGIKYSYSWFEQLHSTCGLC